MIAAFHDRIKSPFMMAIFCLTLIALSIRLAPKNCNAFENEGSHENHLQLAPAVNWLDFSMYPDPVENRCSCSSSDNSCCKDTITSKKPKDPGVCLVCRDSQQRLSVVHSTIMMAFSLSSQIQKDRPFDELLSLYKSEVYLSNCTFLI